MALPGLDTANISFIGYWNFLDNGASDITPTEATSAMVNSEEYSNGVQGTIQISKAETGTANINCRVKEDGWIVAWMKRSQPDVVVLATGQSQYQPSVERAINSLYNALSNSGAATYNSSDVGLYNYEYPNATTYQTLYKETTGSDPRKSFIDVDVGVNVYTAWAEGFVFNTANATDVAVEDPGTRTVFASGPGATGNIDMVEGTFLDPGETTEIQNSHNNSGGCRHHAFILWSE